MGCGSVCGMYVCACAEGVCVEGALEWECVGEEESVSV